MSLEEYLGLIPVQHRQRPKYMASLTALLKPLQNVEDLLEKMRAAFDLDTAVGVQLDAVGVRVGRSRLLSVPLENVYFAWNNEDSGWNQVIWKARHDPERGLVSLPDDFYRLLLKAKVAANQWDGTSPGACEVWKQAFADLGSLILIQDNQDMSMIVGIAGMPPGKVLKELLLQGYVPLKPEGVRINWYAVSAVKGPLLAWNAQSEALDGWNKGGWPERLIPTGG